MQLHLQIKLDLVKKAWSETFRAEEEATSVTESGVDHKDCVILVRLM